MRWASSVKRQNDSGKFREDQGSGAIRQKKWGVEESGQRIKPVEGTKKGVLRQNVMSIGGGAVKEREGRGNFKQHSETQQT